MPTVIFQDAPCRAEFLSLLSSPQVDPLSADFSTDFGGGVPASGGSIATMGLEWRTAETQDSALAHEHPVTSANTPALPAEFLGGSFFSMFAFPLQKLQVSRADASIPTEDFATLRRDSVTPVEISGTTLTETSPLPLEHPGAVFGQSPVTVEYLQVATADSSVEMELVAQLRVDWLLPLEASSSLLQSWTMPAEVVVAVTAQPSMPAETVGSVSESQPLAAEFLSTDSVSSLTQRLEWLATVQPADSSMPDETVIGLSQIISPPAEMLLSEQCLLVVSSETLSALGQPAAAAAEWLSQEQQSATLQFESFSINVSEIASSPVESLLTAAGSAQMPIEFFSQLVGVSSQPQEWPVSTTGVVSVPAEIVSSVSALLPTTPEWLTIEQGTTALWAEQSTVVQLTHPESGEWLTGESVAASVCLEWTTSMSWAQQLPAEWLVTATVDTTLDLEHLGSTVTETVSQPMEHLGSTVSQDARVSFQWSTLVGESVPMPLVTLRTVGFVVGRSFHVRSDQRTVYVGSDAQIWVVDP